MQKTQFHICILVRHRLEHYKSIYLYKVHWSATSSSLLSKRRSIDLSALKIIYNKAINDGITDKDLIQLQSDDAFKQIRYGIDSYCEEKNKSSRPAKLWHQYIEYVDIIKKFFFAERTSNWPLHLQTVIEMANLSAATGHINYARCTRLYVQEMMNLPESHPWLCQQFLDDHHAIRRSDRFWAGL